MARRIVSQSDLLPIIMATRGFDSGMGQSVGRLITLRQQTRPLGFPSTGVNEILVSESTRQLDRAHRNDGRGQILRRTLPAATNEARLGRYGRHGCFEARDLDSGNI